MPALGTFSLTSVLGRERLKRRFCRRRRRAQNRWPSVRKIDSSTAAFAFQLLLATSLPVEEPCEHGKCAAVAFAIQCGRAHVAKSPGYKM
jgi:hypothetical protein